MAPSSDAADPASERDFLHDLPVDVVDDLKRIAPTLGFTGYQPLLRHYIGQGLRADLERLEDPRVKKLVLSLKKHGVSDSFINDALEESEEQHFPA